MSRKCFISFKTEDASFKEQMQTNFAGEFIDKSLNEAIESDNEEYIMRKIREDYLSDSTVTIHLIGRHSAENLGYEEQKFIKREIQASLFHGENNTRSGILGVVLPQMYNSIYQGSITCFRCGKSHDSICINDFTTIKEFSYNYYIPHDKCSWSEDDRYCVLVRWENFCNDPERYIEQAFEKRNHSIVEKIRVRP